MSKRTVLIVYFSRGVFPLRNTIETHLKCWKRYSSHRCVYVNAAFGLPVARLRAMTIDTIIFHTSFCALRWRPELMDPLVSAMKDVGGDTCQRIAIPQDEFLHSDRLVAMIGDLGIDFVLTCAEPEDQATIYDGADRAKVVFHTVLTGYLDPRTVARLKQFHRPLDQRKRWIGYRAWNAAYWLGEHATHKVRIAHEVEREAGKRGLDIDISLDDDRTITGLDWFRFLAESRATIGVEGGASVLDRDGSLKACVDAYLERNPGAPFAKVRDACFAGRDSSLGLACLSPRHLEAAATRTCQLLIDGHYNGILEPDVHYIPVRKDYSNLSEALDRLADDELVASMIDRAYRDIVGSGRYTYSAFVADIEDRFMPAPTSASSLADRLRALWLNLRDSLNWRLIAAEVSYRDNPARYRWVKSALRPLYRLVARQSA